MEDDVSRRIREIMRVKGWKERELAREAGLKSGSHVGLLLDRGAGNAHAKTLQKIADAANVDMAWLMSGVGEGPVEGDDDERPQESPPVEAHFEAAPTLAAVTQWAQSVEVARAMEPGIPAFIWGYLADGQPLLTETPTPAMLIDLAKLVWRHFPTPESLPPAPKRWR